MHFSVAVVEIEEVVLTKNDNNLSRIQISLEGFNSYFNYKPNMKTLKLLVAITFAFVFFDMKPSFAQDQDKVMLPEPVLPFPETGKYAERLTKIKEYLRSDMDKFVKSAYKLQEEISEKRQRHYFKGGEYTKEDFAASEWFSYLVCSAPFPKFSHAWEKNCRPHFGLLGAVTGGYLGKYRKELRHLQLEKDLKKFHKNHATYIATTLRRLRKYHDNMEEEILGLDVRMAEYRIKLADEFFELEIKNGLHRNNPDGIAARHKRAMFRNEHTLLRQGFRAMTSAKENNERRLVALLVRYFSDSPTEVLRYLNLAGYDNEFKIADLLLRMKENAEGTDLFEIRLDKFMKNGGYLKKNLKALASKERERNSIRISAAKKRWEEAMKKVLKEDEERGRERERIFEKLFREMPRKDGDPPGYGRTF